MGHQADLEVLEGKHKDLEAGVASLLSEKHALEVRNVLVRPSFSRVALLCTFQRGVPGSVGQVRCSFRSLDVRSDLCEAIPLAAVAKIVP